MIASVVIFQGGGKATADPSPLPPEGVLRLQMTGSGSKFVWETPAGVQAQSALGGTRCAVTLGSPALASLTVEAPAGRRSVGLADLGLGVCARSSDGSSAAGRIDSGEALVIELAGPLANFEVKRAELDIEAKFGGILKAEMYLDGVWVGTKTIDTSQAPDSSPDNGATDNVRLELEPTIPFDKLILRTESGAFSLDGGGDGTAPGPIGGLGDQLNTSDSLFELTNGGTLDCVAPNNVATLTQGGYNISYTRNLNVATPGCALKVFTLSVANVGGEDGVLFAPTGGDPDATFRGAITWPPETAANPLPATQINFGAGNQAIKWCAGTYTSPQLPAVTEKWCLVSHQATLVTGGKVQVTEEYYGQGDPFTWR